MWGRRLLGDERQKRMGIKEKPKRSKADIALTITKAGISGIPVVGGSAAELFSLIIVPPLSKRRDEWIERPLPVWI
jgi:hypothetical protein